MEAGNHNAPPDGLHRMDGSRPPSPSPQPTPPVKGKGGRGASNAPEKMIAAMGWGTATIPTGSLGLDHLVDHVVRLCLSP